MYILRAFPFSFAILWRYALVFPVMFLVLLIYGTLAVVLGLIFGLASPAFAVLIAAGFGMAASVIPVMVGTRVGLQARGVQPRTSYVGLIVPAVGYGLFEGFCLMIVVAVAVGSILATTPIGFAELREFGAQGNDVLFEQLLASNAPVTLAVIAVASFWMIAIRTALLVSFAGASVGKDPSGRAHTPFYGFGSGFWSILVLVIMSYVGTALIAPGVAVLAEMFGFADTVRTASVQIATAAETRDITVIGLDFVIMFMVWALLFLWFYSLQCAGAALVYLRHKESYDLDRDDYYKSLEEPLEPVMPKTDMRELVRSRMPQNRR
ncbi:MAG: hypothetical protein AAF754_14250 [Pseudomonadota bacterium]